MTRTTRKYVLDTHLFIAAFRDPTANEALPRFYRTFAPLEYLFANDVLLRCRVAKGCVLVTQNDRAFQRIRRHVSFEFVKPWPGVAPP